jgi:hypothetical protein
VEWYRQGGLALANDRLEEIERLHRLRAAGALTHSEYEREKARILGDGEALSAGRVSVPDARGRRHPLPLVVGAAAVAGLAALLSWWGFHGLSEAPVPPPRSRGVAARPATAAVRAMPARIATTMPGAALQASPAPMPSPWVGHYKGPVEGAAGDLVIDPRPAGEIHLALTVASPTCTGEISFLTKAPAGNTLVLTQRSEDSDEVCRLTMYRSGRRLSIQEQSCLEFHGFECDFEGRLTR